MQNTNTLKNVVNFNSAENSVQLYIDLAHKNLTVNNSKIESITMYADAECAGDLAVNWEAADDADYVHNSSPLCVGGRGGLGQGAARDVESNL